MLLEILVTETIDNLVTGDIPFSSVSLTPNEHQNPANTIICAFRSRPANASIRLHHRYYRAQEKMALSMLRSICLHHGQTPPVGFVQVMHLRT